MAFIDYATQQIRTKVVWYGPSGSGKTASLTHVFERTRGPDATTIVRKDPANPGAASYDVLPLQLGEIRGFKTHFELFTVPGAREHAGARFKLLESVDGLVFTADARPARRDENLLLLGELRAHLAHHRFALEKMPFVVQCTFTDAPGALPPNIVAAPLLAGFPDPAAVPVFATVPPQGTGVFDAVKGIAKLVLTELKKGG